MEILQELGAVIRCRRKAMKLSQEKLAELADVHRTYIGAVERGEQNICFVNLCRIAASLNVPLSEMLESLDESVVRLFYNPEHRALIYSEIELSPLYVKKYSPKIKRIDMEKLKVAAKSENPKVAARKKRQNFEM